MNAVKRSRSTASRSNGNGYRSNAAAALALPRPARELAPALESLLLRDTPHAMLAELSLAQAAQQSASAATGAFRLPAFFGAELEARVWTPPVNARENDEEMILEAYIPGVAKGDIEVEVKNGSTLVIRGERRATKDEENEGASYHRKEFSFRKFFRSFALPLEIDPEGAVANYRDGILEISLRKKPEAKNNTYRVSTAG